MDLDHRVVEEDRLSNLPDELLHKILSCFDMKFVVQMCLFSSRWKLLWTSMPCLNFSYYKHFHTNLPKFAKFVTHVLSHRNHQIELSSVKLSLPAAESFDQHDFLEKIANSAFSRNIVQQLTVSNSFLSSKSHINFTIDRYCFFSPKTPLDFPVLTTLNLSYIIINVGDLFSKCVNLKNLTLENFWVKDVKVFDIISPRLSNLVLIDGDYVELINVIAPQLENLTIKDCSISYLNAPPGLSSFCYTFHLRWFFSVVLQFSNDWFHSLNKVTICMSYIRVVVYKQEHAHKTFNLLQQLRTARYLTLNTEFIQEFISSFTRMSSHRRSPFRNLNCLTIESGSVMNDEHKIKLCTEARNFLLENSRSAKFILKYPKVPSRR